MKKILCLSISLLLLTVLYTKKTYAQINVDDLYLPAVEVLTLWEDKQSLKSGPPYFAYAQAPKGGKFRIGAIGTFDNFNPFAKRGRIGAYSGILFETLGQYTFTDEFRMQGVIVETFRVAKDHYSVLMNLRKNAYFSDGKLITAKDVVFSFNALTQDATPVYRSYYENVVSCEALDEHTVIFRFNTDKNKELSLIIGQMPVLPAHWWEGRDIGEPQTEPILGSGPYKVKEVTMGSRIIYERDENWWGKDVHINQGLYNYDYIEIDYFRDVSVMREAFFAGVLDFFSEGTIKDWINGYDVPAVNDGFITKAEQEIPITRGTGIYLNTRNPFLADINVRKALILLFDFEWTNKALFHSAYSRFSSFFSEELEAKEYPTENELAVLDAYKDRLPATIFGSLPKIPVTDASGRNAEGIRTALSLLQESGWKLQNGKLLNAKGEQLSLDLIITSQSSQRIYLPYQKTLARVGIELNIRLIDTTQYLERVRGYDFDLLQAVIHRSEDPGNEQRRYWTSAAGKSRDERNYAGIQDPIIDEVVEKLIVSSSRDEIRLYSNVLDRLLQHGYYVIYPWASNSMRYAYWNTNLTPSPTPYEKGISIWTWFATQENLDKFSIKN